MISRRFFALSLLAPSAALSLFAESSKKAELASPVNVPTWHYDAFRSGVNTNETLLTPALVNSGTFGLLFELPTDDLVYAQPLYLAGVSIPGRGIHNVVYAVSEGDTVFAYDADSNTGGNAEPLWVVQLTDPSQHTSAVPISDYNTSDGPLSQLGITGTPVIDPATGTLYVVAHIKDTSGVKPPYYHLLCALDVATGAQKFGGPVIITASVVGAGSNSINGMVEFSDFDHQQRSGLLLLNGVVYIAFASVGDRGPYHGWLLGYDAKTLRQVSVFNDTPYGVQGGIWMSGAGPAADSEGSIYLMTGNGSFDGQTNFGDSFVKLVRTSGLSGTGMGLRVKDYFTPEDQAILAGEDGDLGSGGPIILPDEAGSAQHPHLMIGAGKDGILSLIDRDNMGHYSPTTDNQIVQTVPMPLSNFTDPVYFNHRLFVNPIASPLYCYAFTNASLSTSPIFQSTEYLGSPGGSPILTANGLENPIVWIVQATGFYAYSSSILRAYDANDISRELYNNTQAGQRDLTGIAMKFSTPVVSNGKVYVGTGSGVAVFGVFPPPSISYSEQHEIIVEGKRGVACTVQGSSNLEAAGDGWQTITTITLDGSPQMISDPVGETSHQRFYRAVLGTP